MRLQKSAYALLLGAGLSVVNIGCAAVDALVNSPAGSSAGSGSPQRLAEIGQVLENQGRYTQARSMYRQALRTDPKNSIAQAGLKNLASPKSAANRRAEMATKMAMADAASPGRAAKKTASRLKPINKAANNESKHNESPIQVVRAFESSGQVKSASLTIGGELEEVSKNQTIASLDFTQDVQTKDNAFGKPTDSAKFDFAAIETRDEQDTADSKTNDIVVVSRQEAFDGPPDIEVIPVSDHHHDATNIEITELFPSDTIRDDVGFWRPARTTVSLAEVLAWSEAPGQNSEQLISAIKQGQDEGVRALSVALLGEIQEPDAAIITALKQAANAGTPMVKAAALDALAIQGQNDSESLDSLLGLLAGDDPNIRKQAAATLLRMADTEWCDDAIQGLHQLLDDQNDAVVAVAATSLSEFGIAAVPCRKRLTQIAATTSSDLVLEAAGMALSRIPRSDE